MQDKDKYDFSNIEVEDGENYSSPNNLGKEQIVYRALQRCLEEGAKEMSGGGIITRIVDGVEENFPTVNQREIFINSIKMFWSLILPIILNNHVDWCKKEVGNWTKDLKDIKELGPDPFDKNFTFKKFKARLRGNRAINQVLMDPKTIAGIVNIL